jgi:uncharacterized membrane protein
MKWLKESVRVLLSVGMVAAGTYHFVHPEPFVRIVPAFLPAPLLLVHVSGVFEILFGLALWVPRLRWYAAWGLVLLFVAVFPANINMAVNQLQLDPSKPLPEWVAWARLPFQMLFIGCAYYLRK